MMVSDPIVQAQIDALNGEIAALLAAVTSGVTSVSYEGRSVQYDNLDGMFRRIAFAQRMVAKLQNPGMRRPTCGFATFNKGYRPQFSVGGYFTRTGF